MSYMRAPDSFPSDLEYDIYLQRQAEKGKLLVTTVDDETREAMLGQLLDPEPPEGIYMEVGPGLSPYCEESPRDFTRLHYVGIDGGRSEYDRPIFSSSSDYEQSVKGGIFAKGRSLSARKNTPLATFLCGDARCLPLPDSDRPLLSEEAKTSALPIRETFMRNVLMAPNTHPRSVERILQEQARVLATDALMVIRETELYHYNSMVGTGRSGRFLSLLADLERTGFTNRIFLFDTDLAYPEIIQQFPGGEDSKYQFGGYYIIAQQGAPTRPERRRFPTWRRALAGILGVPGYDAPR